MIPIFRSIVQFEERTGYFLACDYGLIINSQVSIRYCLHEQRIRFLRDA